ncbi:fimbria/pilus outer membrane usher protein [Shewanella sp. WE21]|uniref:fimbria/pilus outer membrane usher protein n=1 Tax=Shewanella sp. WE21 TaxID=2029986 RepID=UPI0020B14469|nr:fimbria/pilus outer membrane usher protein [Shewanella sp. WE21]
MMNYYTRITFFIFTIMCSVSLCLNADELEENEVEEYTFDNSLLFGSGYGNGYIDRFNSITNITPGQYQVDIYVNGTYLDRRVIDFVNLNEKNVIPCLDQSFWVAANVKSINIKKDSLNEIECVAPENIVYGVSTKFDVEKLKLDVAIPQAFLMQTPRGYVNPAFWDGGEAAGFLSYNTNYYQTHGSTSNNMRALYAGFNSGVNIGLWRLRNQSSYQYSDVGQNTHERFKSINTHVARAIPSLQSEILLGETYTRGNILGSLGFTGLQLHTDTRMLPDSQRGYAPVIRGLANSTANVVIKQKGVSIYQTTVAPGPFVITDLYPTNYQGDLLVEITEIDGKTSTFTVPFSAVPGSLREDKSIFAFSIGEVQQFDSGNYFADLTYEYGINNMLTLNGGGRVGDDYYAMSLGAVLGTQWGAFGLTTVHSSSRLYANEDSDSWENGWRVGINYSHSFDYGTSVSLAGYHYSTESFRELNDVLGLRKAFEENNYYGSDTLHQRAEMSFSVNQSLHDYGLMYLSASKRQYRDGRSDDDQLQVGYSVNFGSVSLGLTFSRQYMSQAKLFDNFLDNDLFDSSNELNSNRIKEDLVNLSISIPFGGSQSHMLNTGYSRSSQGNENYNLGLSGTVDEDKSWTYGLNASLQQNQGSTESMSINTQKRFSQSTVSGSYAISDNNQQLSAGLSGSAVMHSGGITLSQNLSDTFAIVEAKGAAGATVSNNWGIEVDQQGFAIIPSLTPYKVNRVTLGSGSMSGSAELMDTQQQVTPYAGAIVKMKFDTRQGVAALFLTKHENGDVIPIGAEVIDSDGHVLGMVGQAGMAYVRTSADSGELKIVWGDTVNQQCTFTYILSHTSSSELQRLPVSCQSAIQ